MNPTLVQREFGVKEDAEQDLKRSSSASFNAMDGFSNEIFQDASKASLKKVIRGHTQTGNVDS